MKGKNMYDEVIDELKKWCDHNYYSSLIAEIEVGERRIKTLVLLDFNYDNDDIFEFEFEFDWWEGERNVKLIGITPIPEVETKYFLRKEIK